MRAPPRTVRPQWLEGVARAVINDGWQALRSVPPVTTKDVRALIPAGDLDFELAFKAARTAFSNFTKKWVSQTDPAAIQKAIIDAKRGRRWARKDLVCVIRYLGLHQAGTSATVEPALAASSTRNRSRKSDRKPRWTTRTPRYTARSHIRISSSSTICRPSARPRETTPDSSTAACPRASGSGLAVATPIRISIRARARRFSKSGRHAGGVSVCVRSLHQRLPTCHRRPPEPRLTLDFRLLLLMSPAHRHLWQLRRHCQSPG